MAIRRDLKTCVSELKIALQPFADLVEICDRFGREDEDIICSWRISGQRHKGPTVRDCRNAKAAIDFADRF